MRTPLLLVVLAVFLLTGCAMFIPQETRESTEFKTACKVARLVHSCASQCKTTNLEIQEAFKDPKVLQYYSQIELGVQAALAACPVEGA